MSLCIYVYRASEICIHILPLFVYSTPLADWGCACVDKVAIWYVYMCLIYIYTYCHYLFTQLRLPAGSVIVRTKSLTKSCARYIHMSVDVVSKNVYILQPFVYSTPLECWKCTCEDEVACSMCIYIYGYCRYCIYILSLFDICICVWYMYMYYHSACLLGVWLCGRSRVLDNICVCRCEFPAQKWPNVKKRSLEIRFARRSDARLPYPILTGWHQVCITRQDDPALRLPTNRGRENHLFVPSVPPLRLTTTRGRTDNSEHRAWQALGIIILIRAWDATQRRGAATTRQEAGLCARGVTKTTTGTRTSKHQDSDPQAHKQPTRRHNRCKPDGRKHGHSA